MSCPLSVSSLKSIKSSTVYLTPPSLSSRQTGVRSPPPPAVAYWHADRPDDADDLPEVDDVVAGVTGEYANPDECCFALRRRLAMLDVITLQGSAVRWWYME